MAGALLLAGMSVARADESVATYKADLSHAKLGFRISHLVISKVSGEFKAYDATLTLDGSSLVSAEAKIKADSIDTGVADRDAHLRNADFLNVEKHPELTFKSKAVRGNLLIGDLTICGVTKPVELKYTVKGPIQDPWGKTKIGFEATGQINRQDFGLTWSKALETGGLVVGDEVDLLIDIEFEKQ